MPDARDVYREKPSQEEIDDVLPARWRSWTGGLLHAETERELRIPYDDAWLPD